MKFKHERTELFLEIYEAIRTSREMDILEQDYTQRGEAFFHVSGSGHENIAFLHPHLIKDDYLHCHYRDKSLMLARGISVKQFFLSLFCKDQSHSRGRQMVAHLSAPELNILSMVGPVGNNALQAAGVAAAIKDRPAKPLVLCGLGDGTSQQGEVLEAIAHTVRDSLPVLFVIEDNTWAISTKTRGRTFYSRPDGEADEFYGIPIVRIDGLDALKTYQAFGEVVKKMRQDRKPAIVVFQVARLNSHTNADDHRTYRSAAEIEETKRTHDPVTKLENWLVENGVEQSFLDDRIKTLKASVAKDAKEAQISPDPQPTFTAKAELPARLSDPKIEYLGKKDNDQITMLEAIREVLKNRLESDERVLLFGEDIEDPKGDVFGVTKGLGQSFPGRVQNSPLAESTIVGVSIGQALAGKRPVAFLQFADFFAIGYNQIWAELGSMHWRTDGGWKSPVILMVTCGGFKPGLGPFHASSMESIAVHTPGVDVFLPSSAGDAAGLLNAAFESERPTIFFYPKSCLNDRTQSTSKDVAKQIVPIGKARFFRKGSDITFVAWGNTVGLCRKAAEALEHEGVESEIIDLRSLSPWDINAVVDSVRKTKRLVIAQEDSHSASMASEISATVAELVGIQVQIRRVSRADTYVPCNFANQLDVFPSYKRILEQAVEILGGTMVWHKEDSTEAGFDFVEAVGSSPSDESVTVIEWRVKPGDILVPGMELAEMEADKAAFELSCPIEGTLKEILVPVGEMVKVGTRLLKVAVDSGAPVVTKPITMENPGTPLITLDLSKVRASSAGDTEKAKPADQAQGGGLNIIKTIAQVAGFSKPETTQDKAVASIVGLSTAPGSRIVSNADISKTCPSWDPDDIYKRIGIERRYWAADDEDALVLAVRAAKKVLENNNLRVSDLSALICTTGTPTTITPSLACLVLNELATEMNDSTLMPAWDINAACSGYLYGLQAAYDHLYFNPDGLVLLVTSEVLSRKTDPTDASTAPIFGDASTASIIAGANWKKKALATIERPILASKAEDGSSLKVPLLADDYIFMDGPKVFVEAVKHMVLLLEKACAASNIKPADLDLVVPHQANQRILNAVRQKARLAEEKVYSNIRHFGNTSSSSIPLALEKIFASKPGEKTLGLCAFGGGFTFGGGIIRTK